MGEFLEVSTWQEQSVWAALRIGFVIGALFGFAVGALLIWGVAVATGVL